MVSDVITSGEALDDLRLALLRRHVHARLTVTDGAPTLHVGLRGYEYGRGRVTVAGGAYQLHGAPGGTQGLGPVGRDQLMVAADRVLSALGWGPRV